MKKRSIKGWLSSVLAVVFWLLLWQFAAAAANRNLLIAIPTPITTLAALAKLAVTSSFWVSIGESLLRICAGFLLALLVGAVCAVLSVKIQLFQIITAPLLKLIRAIPVASFTILVFLWVSRNKIPTVIVFFTVLPIIWANLESGLRSMDRQLTEMAQVFGMKPGACFRHITLPCLRSYLDAAFTSGIGFAWKSGVAVEVICRTGNSLGNLLWAGKSTVDYDSVFATTLVIILLSSLLQKLSVSLAKGRTGYK